MAKKSRGGKGRSEDEETGGEPGSRRSHGEDAHRVPGEASSRSVPGGRLRAATDDEDAGGPRSGPRGI